MNADLNEWTPKINLIAAWVGILLGFLSGLVLGLFFHREDWLGGYASFRRRLYRLAHISLFGLAAVNLMFFFTAQPHVPRTTLMEFASWAFIIGAVSMPVCCIVMAHHPGSQPLFAIPVVSLMAGAILTLTAIIRPGEQAKARAHRTSLSINSQPQTIYQP